MTLRIDIPRGLSRELDMSATLTSEAELSLIAKLESGRAGLPVLPAVAASALDVANDPNADIGRFSRLIETDPPIAARFLAVANSALYSRGKKITSVMDAVLRIGLYSARDLLFQAVYGASLRGLGAYQAQVEDSFERSVACAVVARSVASYLRSGFREAYLCGLLHDIGESRVYRVLAELELGLNEADAAELVMRYHTRAGAELADKWKLPKEIVEVCAMHHEPGLPASEALRVVRIADWAVLRVKSYAETSEHAPIEDVDLEQLEELSVDRASALGLIEHSARELTKGSRPSVS